MTRRALSSSEQKRIERKLDELIATAKIGGDRDIEKELADFIRAEFGLSRDRAEATAKAYGASWRKTAISTCASAFRLRLADAYPNEEIPPLWCFEMLECDIHDDKPLDETGALELAKAIRLTTRFWRDKREHQK
jgi:hypothetical protein